MVENQVPLAGIRLFFKNCISRMVFTSSKKSLNKRILFQIDRISVPISENGEFVEEHLSTRRKNCLH